VSYATPSQMLTRYDARRLGDLVVDGDKTTPRATPTQLLSDPVLAEMLADASGLIDAALLVGGRYSPADLATLAAVEAALPTPSSTFKLLVRLTCDLAYGLLVRRRGLGMDLAPGYAEAAALLDRLSNGELIFDVAAVVEAGRTRVVQLSRQIGHLSTLTRVFGDLATFPSNPNDTRF
jgi:phage gp36-like protein